MKIRAENPADFGNMSIHAEKIQKRGSIMTEEMMSVTNPQVFGVRLLDY